MNLWERIKKGITPDNEEQFGDDVFEADEMYDTRDHKTDNIDMGDFISSGNRLPYENTNQSSLNQVQETYNTQFQGSDNMKPLVEFVVVKPEDCNNPPEIADYLLNGKTVLLNLEETTVETARRLKDFLCGVAYSIHGNIEKVSSKTFVITPKNVVISSDILKKSPRRNARTESSGIPNEARN